ncbi:putative NDR1/HIN1-like protein 2 [Cocos nucifera]|uniref:Putative NDR1/HIN1-like protein 2 n=1 Tax=Cocos nucifera TaxID=13894 RepID=A0A8K0IGG4_COCNU|nr:putative NDR1/HIN1-like protein 2 [Cocos nucifera]
MPSPRTRSTPSPYSRTRPPNLLRWIAITALVFLILVGLAILIFWLVVRPSSLRYSVDDASIHGFNLTANELNASFNLTLRADNPNHRVGVYYDTFDVEVWISDQRVAFTEVAPFYQGHRNVTTIEVDPIARSVPLLTSVADNIKHDRTAGVVEMEVRVRASIRFKVGLAKTKHYTMTVDCSPVVVHLAQSTRFAKTYCDVDI